MLDPHGAVAYKALEDYITTKPGNKGIILETAHPVKFPDVVEELLMTKIPLPESAKSLFTKKKESILLSNTFDKVKEWMLCKA
ncbi:MAG: hypothetical protein PW786_03795 [Arachidicoccus sp.]|nr:hypothetical protein [Arachidicoccus sp.]